MPLARVAETNRVSGGEREFEYPDTVRAGVGSSHFAGRIEEDARASHRKGAAYVRQAGRHAIASSGYGIFGPSLWNKAAHGQGFLVSSRLWSVCLLNSKRHALLAPLRGGRDLLHLAVEIGVLFLCATCEPCFRSLMLNLAACNVARILRAGWD